MHILIEFVRFPVMALKKNLILAHKNNTKESKYDKNTNLMTQFTSWFPDKKERNETCLQWTNLERTFQLESSCLKELLHFTQTITRQQLQLQSMWMPVICLCSWHLTSCFHTVYSKSNQFQSFIKPDNSFFIYLISICSY